MSHSRLLTRLSLRIVGASVAAALVGPTGTVSAQVPAATYAACYVPLTGTVYRIREAGLKTACTASHVEFKWTDGFDALRTTDPAGGDLTGVLSNANVVKLLGRALSTTPPQPGQVLSWDGTAWIATTPAAAMGGVTDHGALTGLANDDHPQYLLANGVRTAIDGFAVRAPGGRGGGGSIPTSGSGARLMWYSGKAAFRAGEPSGGGWDDANIGRLSLATGFATIASGIYSTALGISTHASGGASTAMGLETTASGFASTATGSNTTASGNFSTAMGFRSSTNSHEGSFVYGDFSEGIQSVTNINAVTNNQFVVRAQHFWFGTNNNVIATPGRLLETSTGAFLSSGGAWTNSSDVALKNDFEDVSAEDVLGKIAAMPVRRWSYKAEDPSVRHFGPTAQDFRAAFGLGSAATSIATVDADGVSLLGIQALAKRTRDLQRAVGEVRAANTQLRAANAELLARLERLEAALKRFENR
jgi:flagellin-like hook-associated protein FlgL